MPDLAITDAGPSYNNTTAIGGWAQNPANRTPYSQQWNFFIQRQLPSEVVFNVGYVGSSNHNQIGYVPINTAPIPGPGTLQPRRLMPDYGDINGGLNDFNSNYHGLQTSAVKRFNHGLSFASLFPSGGDAITQLHRFPNFSRYNSPARSNSADESGSRPMKAR